MQRWFISLFASSSIAEEPLLQDWIAASPRSPVPLIASAYYYQRRGFVARGSKAASETSNAQVETMGLEFRKALSLIDQAESLGGETSMLQSLRLNMLATVGQVDNSHLRATYLRVIHDFPDAVQVRVTYIEHSAPRWGGSLGQLEGVERTLEGLSEGARRYVQYVLYGELGNAYFHADRHDKSAQYYAGRAWRCARGSPATSRR